MGKTRILELTNEENADLEKGYRNGPSHAFRTRCQMLLLRSQGRSAREVACHIGCCDLVVYRWVSRYGREGLAGLHTRQGRGRKPILEGPEALAAVKEAVQNNRSRLSLAKAELEEALGLGFSQRTLVRFVKKTVLATNASENVPQKSQTRSFTS